MTKPLKKVVQYFLTPAMHRKLDDLCEKAQSQGWQRDQGSPEAAARAEKEYTDAKYEMEKAIFRLQKENRNLKKQKASGYVRRHVAVPPKVRFYGNDS